MTKQEPDIKVDAVTNNARHGNEIYKPYDKGSVEIAERKLCNYLCKGKPRRKQTRSLLQAVKPYATTLYRPCRDITHTVHIKFLFRTVIVD